MNIDLHVHSRYSKRPTQWILQKIGCPESFTEPMRIYEIARKQGMSLVTITDHNSIEGAMEIAHLPGVFISEEITTYFPENGCKAHVLAYDINEAQHTEIQKIRKNIHDLVGYLNREEIVHVLAHPLYAVNDRLTVEHFEKILLLFKNFELNGSRNARQNRNLRSILSLLTPKDFERLTNQYGIQPSFQEPWRKHLTGGSDDHSGLNIARTFTQIIHASEPTVKEALKGVSEGRTTVIGRASTPLTMAHNLYGIAYQFYRNKFNLDRHAAGDRLLRFLDASLCPESEPESGWMNRVYCFLSYRRKKKRNSRSSDFLMNMIRNETEKLLQERPGLIQSPVNPHGDVEGRHEEDVQNREEKWFDFVSRLINQLVSQSSDHLMGQLNRVNLFNLFQTIGSAGGLYGLISPYFIAFSQFTRHRHFDDLILERFDKKGADDSGNGQVRVAHFTDTFSDVNGVARTLRQQAEVALRNHKHMTIITCGEENRQAGSGIRNFDPVGDCEIPEYNGQKIHFPPFLEMLKYCYENDFTHIQSATPGPVGLAALAISRILNLPVSGTYHTAFPQYAQHLTGDYMMEELTWKYMVWYYDQMDIVHVSSRSSGDELAEKGIHKEKIRLIPRGIDIRAFHPSRRNGFLRDRFGIRERVKLLYVGRVSKEKNLDILAEAYRRLSSRVGDIRLLVVGDGPYLEEMKRLLRDTACTFTGYLSGEALSTIYAGSDIFVFPSTTDTFGNVVLEAQASGLPVIVTDQGGPCENLIPEKTGCIVHGDNADDLEDAMKQLILSPGMRKKMGKAARKYMEDRSFESAFIRYWESFSDISSSRRPRYQNAG